MGKMLISTQELQDLQDRDDLLKVSDQGPALVLLDVRPSMAFLFSHIPGAVHVSWKDFSDPSASVKSLLDADLGRLEKKIGALGVSREHRVVVYGDPLETWGADGRIYWMLEYLGHPSVQVLDGGWMKWKQEGRGVERGPGKAQPADFSAQPVPDLLATKEELKRQLDASSGGGVSVVAIVDARAKEEYAGTQSSGLPREGHILGALNIPWDSFYEQDGTVKPVEEILRIVDPGLRRDQEVVTYCTGGVRSAWLYFVLRLAGFERVRNYAGSWMEWSQDPHLPIER